MLSSPAVPRIVAVRPLHVVGCGSVLVVVVVGRVVDVVDDVVVARVVDVDDVVVVARVVVVDDVVVVPVVVMSMLQPQQTWAAGALRQPHCRSRP